jgi:hypothetical protein
VADRSAAVDHTAAADHSAAADYTEAADHSAVADHTEAADHSAAVDHFAEPARAAVEDHRAEPALDAEGVHISAMVQAGQTVFQHPEVALTAPFEPAASGQPGVPLPAAAPPAWVA